MPRLDCPSVSAKTAEGAVLDALPPGKTNTSAGPGIPITVWFLVGNGGMSYGHYYWGLYKNYYRDPLPHSLLSTS